jgi:hypothetical protein
VYARLKFHPGVTLLHSAAQHISSKLTQAAAANNPRMSAAHIMSLLQSYAMLAYAPPKALLQQLRQQLQPQVLEADPSALASSLWCFCLFKDLSPELWNGAMGLLAQPAVAPAMTAGALSQLYQVRLAAVFFSLLVQVRYACRKFLHVSVRQAGSLPDLLSFLLCSLTWWLDCGLAYGCELCNGVVGLLAQPAVTSAFTAAALSQLYQVCVAAEFLFVEGVALVQHGKHCNCKSTRFPSAAAAAAAAAFQAYLMICKNPDGATLFTIPPQLILTAWQAFKAGQEAAVAAPPSDLIQVRCCGAFV